MKKILDLFLQLSELQKDRSHEGKQKSVFLLEDAARKKQQWTPSEFKPILYSLSAEYLSIGKYDLALKTAKIIYKADGEDLFSCGYLATIARCWKKQRLANYWLKKALKYKQQDTELAEALVENYNKVFKNENNA